QQRFIEHIKEENNHELLATRDLKKLGYTFEDFQELPETKMFYECQYYKIQNIDPLSLLGYIVALEYLSVAVGKKIIKLTEHHKAHAFLKLHSEEDVDHVAKAMNLVNGFQKERKRIIIENMAQSCNGYKLLLIAVAGQEVVDPVAA